MNERILKAIKKLKEGQDNIKVTYNDLLSKIKELEKEVSKSGDLDTKEILRAITDNIARYTIQDGYWFYNGRSLGIKAEGDPGKDGKDGAPGKDGKDGAPGKDGKDGAPGKEGAPGKPGKEGKPGKDGAPGKDGKDGKDPIIKIGKVEEGEASVKLREKDGILYLDFKVPRGNPGFMGFDAKINGHNTIEIIEGDNIEIEQDGNKLKINAIGGGSGGTSDAGKEVHIGADEPTGEETIWIDPNGEPDEIPTKTSDLENDSGFITAPRISEIEYSATGINISNNTVHRFANVMTSLSLALPNEIDELFQCEVVFKSGTTATSLTYDESIKWSGDDIKDNVFVPLASKIYNIIFWYDGFNMNAVVRGV